MGIDTSIYQNLLRPPRSAQEYMNDNLQTAGLQQNLLSARMQMQQQQDATARRNKLMEVYQSGATGDDLAKALLRNGDLEGSLKITKDARENAKTDAEAQKHRLDSAVKAMGAHRDMLTMVNDPQQAAQWVQSAFQNPDLQPIVGKLGTPEQMVRRIPRDPQGFAEWKRANMLGAENFIKQADVLRGQDVQAATTMRGQDMTDARTRAEGAANRSVTMRGQNMTDARSKEANAVQRELAIQEKQLKVDALKDKATERQQAKDASIASTESQIAVIDKALMHPGRATATGLSGSIDPRNYVPGTDAADFRAVLDQIGGTAFLQAFNSLKGGGQITEVEGKKATDAIARLSRAQSDAEFERSLKDLREVMVKGYERQTGKQPTGGASKAGRSVVRTGTLNGRKVVQYSDGTTEYAD